MAAKLNNHPPFNRPRLVSVTDAACALAIGRTKTYDLIDAGKLETIRIGRRRLVKVSTIELFAEREGA